MTQRNALDGRALGIRGDLDKDPMRAGFGKPSMVPPFAVSRAVRVGAVATFGAGAVVYTLALMCGQ
jgi:hypothetical protein